MKKRMCSTVLAFFVMTITVLAQIDTEKQTSKNVIYLNAGSFLIYNSVSLNYNFSIKQSESFFKNYYINVGAGTFNRNPGFALGVSANGVLGAVNIIGLTGKNAKHFEFGLGVSYNADTKIVIGDDDDDKETFLLPSLVIGYRFQKTNKPLFRVGIGIPEAIYIGFGYAF